MNTPSAKPNPESDCEILLNRAFRLAKQILEQHGEFHPFGLALAKDRQIEPVALRDEREFPPPEDIIKMVRDSFVASASKGEILASALISNIKTLLPAGGQSDAVAIVLDHRDNYSITALIPYELRGSEVVPGVMFTRPGEGGVFPSRQ